MSYVLHDLEDIIDKYQESFLHPEKAHFKNYLRLHEIGAEEMLNKYTNQLLSLQQMETDRSTERSSSTYRYRCS